MDDNKAVLVKHVSMMYRRLKNQNRRGLPLREIFKREYESVEALKDISFHMSKGEILGYLGPNGAGKSTTIKIVSGIMEPTIGLDIIAKEQILNFLKNENMQRKNTILITSHDLNDIEVLCHRILIIDSGSTIFEGTKEKLISQYCRNNCVLSVKTDFLQEYMIDKWKECLSVGDIKNTENEIMISFHKEEIAPMDILKFLYDQGIQVMDFTLSNVDLEEAIKCIYSKTPL